MSDLLVPLYSLPEAPNTDTKIEYRLAMAHEQEIIANWVTEHFNQRWAGEVRRCFSQQPIACYIAVDNQTLMGFSCVNATAPGFFGPTGVLEAARGYGIGKQLLFLSLNQLKQLGHGYAFIGGAGPIEFYQKTVNAQIIAGSTPGIYPGYRLKG